MSKPSIMVKKILSKTLSTTTTYEVGGAFADFTASPIAFLSAVENANGATLDVDVNVSLDGTNYEEVLSFTQLSATGHELKAFTIPPFARKVRVVCTLSAEFSWTVNLWLAGPASGGSGS